MAFPIKRVIPALAAVLLLTVGTLWIFRQGWVGRPVSRITDPQGMELAGAETPWIRKILKEGGVLLGSDGPMTTDDSVWYFRQRLERHLDARLEVVRLEGQSYDAWLFTAENGEAWVSSVHGASVNEAPVYGEPSRVQALSVNQWGRIMGLLDGTGFCLALIQERDLLENYDEAKKMDETYLQPVSSILGERLWQSSRQLTEEMIRDLVRQLSGGQDHWTLEEMMELVAPYFPQMLPEQVEAAVEPWYDPVTKTVTLPASTQPYTGSFRVLDWWEESVLGTLEIHYVPYDPVTGVEAEDSYLLTIERGEEGISYRSNQYAPYENPLDEDTSISTFQVAASRNRNRLELFSGEAGGCRLYYGDRQANVPVFLDPDQVHYPLGSFISRPKTALVYGGIPEESPQPLSVLISDDAGEHWISGDLSAAAQKGESFHQRLVGFSTRLEGWILLGGRGGSTGQRLYGYLTSDGGQSWQELPMPEPAGQLLSGAFTDSKHGFVLTSGKGDGPELYRTRNRGREWKKVSLPQEFLQAARTGSVSGPMTLKDGLLLVCEVPGEGEVFCWSQDQGASWIMPSQEGSSILSDMWQGETAALSQLE